jgi:hypothetical protein
MRFLNFGKDTVIKKWKNADMSKKDSFEIVIDLVQSYVDGKIDRVIFDLDFYSYMKHNYSKMERKYGELADCFSFYLLEEGYDLSETLTNTEHKKLIRKQFKEFKSAMRDGIL